MFHVINFLASQILPVSAGFFYAVMPSGDGYNCLKRRDLPRLLMGCRPYRAGRE